MSHDYYSITHSVWKQPMSPSKIIKIRQYERINLDLFRNDLINISWEKYQLIPSVNKYAAWKTGEGRTSALDRSLQTKEPITGRQKPEASFDKGCLSIGSFVV